MKHVNVSDFRKTIADHVMDKEIVVLTRNKRPVAVVLPVNKQGHASFEHLDELSRISLEG